MNPGRRILFVDNDTETTRCSVRVLKNYNFNVHIATSGKFALRVLRSNNFNLVIADINMPGMDCVDFVKRIRKNNSIQSIVLIINPPLFECRRDSFRLGTIEYLAKPISAVSLLETVNRSQNGKFGKLLGSVHLSSEELIQLYTLGQRSVILQISTGVDTGQFFFKNGMLVHAVAGNLVGEEAFFEMLSWRSGIFTDFPLHDKCPRTIRRTSDMLLIEWERIKIDRSQIILKEDTVHQRQEISIAF